MQEERNEQTQLMHVIVVKDGIPKEIKNLPKNVVKELEEAYDREKVVGISRETFNSMVHILEPMLKKYYENLDELKNSDDPDSVFQRTIAFCQAFEIYSNESKLLLEALFWIDRADQERESFSSRDVSRKEMSKVLERYAYSSNVYVEAGKDFRAWAKSLFTAAGLKRVGVVRFCKFFWQVINT